MSSAIERYKNRAASLSSKLRQAPIERKMGLALSGATLGALERKGTLPVQMFGLPTKPVLAVIAGLVEANTSGTMHKIAGLAADTAIATYFYAVGKGGTYIAGEDDDPENDTEI